MSDWVWLAIWTAYGCTAMAYARAAVRRWATEEHSLTAGAIRDHDGFGRTGSAAGALALGFVWPVAILWQLLVKTLWSSADGDKARRVRLQKDREDWAARERSASTDDERRMAHDIRITLDEILERGGR